MTFLIPVLGYSERFCTSDGSMLRLCIQLSEDVRRQRQRTYEETRTAAMIISMKDMNTVKARMPGTTNCDVVGASSESGVKADTSVSGSSSMTVVVETDLCESRHLGGEWVVRCE